MKAPDFAIASDNGRMLRLADFAGRKLVIFFYPRADTPSCTKEAVDFSRLAPDFRAAGAEILGISADTAKAQTKFRGKHGLTVPLGSDPELAVITAFQVWGEKSMYGRAFMGILRTTVLIDETGKIAQIWRNVRVDGHAESVLEAVRAS